MSGLPEIDNYNAQVGQARLACDEAISTASHAQVSRDCFAEFILGLAEGETRGLAMTVDGS